MCEFVSIKGKKRVTRKKRDKGRQRNMEREETERDISHKVTFTGGGTFIGTRSSSSADVGDSAGVLLRTPAPGWIFLCGLGLGWRGVGWSLSWSWGSSGTEEGNDPAPPPPDRVMELSVETRTLILRLKRWRLCDATWVGCCCCCCWGGRGEEEDLS